jgi:hypothetical protein
VASDCKQTGYKLIGSCVAVLVHSPLTPAALMIGHLLSSWRDPAASTASWLGRAARPKCIFRIGQKRSAAFRPRLPLPEHLRRFSLLTA